MSESKNNMLRLSALINGAPSAVGIVFTIDSSATFEQLLEKANGVLGDAGPFTKVFLPTGAEVKSFDVVRDNDVLVFAKAGDLCLSAGGSAGLLQNIANSAVALSGNLYTTYVPKVKEAVPFVVKPIERVEEFAGQIQPRIELYAQGYGVPALQWADSKLVEGYTRLQAGSDRFLQSELGQKANEILVEKTYRPVEAFFNQAMENWREQQKVGKLTVTEFVGTLKEKMGSAWSEHLVAPAQSFYHAVQEESKLLFEQREGESKMGSLLVNVKKRLGPAWEAAVAKAPQLPARIKDPAAAFYQAAVESFVALQMSAAAQQVTVNEFITGVRVKLGGLWEQQLSPIAAQLFDVLHIQQQAQEAEVEEGAVPMQS